MANASVLSTNSLAKQSRLIIGSNAGADLTVASVTTTTVVVDDITPLTGTGLYSGTRPGLLIIADSAAGDGNNGDVANITGISGSTLTVDVDFATGGELADGDIITVLPPLSFELFPNGGHTLNTTNNNDFTKGVTETFDTHNTPMDYRLGGDLPIFLTSDSDGLGRIIMAGVGAYKLNSSTHTFRPIEADDGTFAAADDLTVYSQDGNSLVNQAFYGLFATNLTLDFPEGGVATANLSLTGNGAVREVGGTGKVIQSGANEWVSDQLECDTGIRHTFRGVFMELGGNFGDALDVSAAEKTVKSLTVNISRGAIEDQVLGAANIVKPEEAMFEVSITGNRILSDDSFHELDFGASTDAVPGAKTETRVLIKAISASDATKTLTIDVPRAIFEQENIERTGQARFTESFTIRGLATRGSDGCVSTATPPVQIELVNGSTTDLAAAL